MEGCITMASVRSNTDLVPFRVEKLAAPVSLQLKVITPSRASPAPRPESQKAALVEAY